jgi:hypothetical protein
MPPDACRPPLCLSLCLQAVKFSFLGEKLHGADHWTIDPLVLNEIYVNESFRADGDDSVLQALHTGRCNTRIGFVSCLAHHSSAPRSAGDPCVSLSV